MLLAIALRLPWFDAPLGRDEAGVSMVARAWHGSHPFPYGPYFLDRPPLLVLLYRWANDWAGPTGVRVLGMVAASLVVVVCTLLAARVAGRGAVIPAALLAAGLSSSALLDSIFTPAELLAAVPSATSVLLLLVGLRRRDGIPWQLPAAGVAAACALLVKQSFGDALFAGAVGLAVAAVNAPWRLTLRRCGAYAAGVGAVALGLVAWDQAAGISGRTPDSVSYALAGFRVDAVTPLTQSHIGSRLATLGLAAAGSGLALAVLVAVAGIVTLRRRRVTASVLLAWLLAGLVGVLGGGSYWSHYLIELVPVSVVGVAAVVAWRPRIGAALCAAALATGVATSVDHVAQGRPAEYQHAAVVMGNYLRARALKGDTAYVLYAKVNALFYSGLPSPFPFHWSLMMMSVPSAEPRLRALLASPRRPTWIVQVNSTRDYGLDRSGQTARELARYYRRAGHVCGRVVLLARTAGPRPPAAMREPCRVVPGDGVDMDL